jgi:hypothetical protein
MSKATKYLGDIMGGVHVVSITVNMEQHGYPLRYVHTGKLEYVQGRSYCMLDIVAINHKPNYPADFESKFLLLSYNSDELASYEFLVRKQSEEFKQLLNYLMEDVI